MNIVVVVLLLAAAMVAPGCKERAPIQRSADDPFLTSPAHVAYNVKVHFTDSNKSKAILYAHQGAMNDQTQTTTMTGKVVVDFYNQRGNAVEARLTADSLIVDDRTKNMTAFGAVRVESTNQRMTLTTTKLMWIHATSHVRTDAAVHIETASESIDGVGFESNQDLSSYRLFQVRGIHRK